MYIKDCMYGQKYAFNCTHTISTRGRVPIRVGACRKWSLLQQALHTTWQVIYGNQSPMCNRKSGILPSASPVYCYCSGSGTVCTLGWDYPQFIILQCVTITVWLHHLQYSPLSYWMNYCWLIDAANSQTMMLRPRALLLLLYICYYNNWCSILVGLIIIRHQLKNTSIVGYRLALTNGLQHRQDVNNR